MSDKMKNTELKRTAYHEAGHAVLAHYLGVGLKAVTIVADDDSDGASIDGGEWNPDTEELRLIAADAFWQRMAIVRYAGAEAVRRLSPKSNWRRGAGNDYHWAAIALEKITSDADSLRALSAYAKRRARLLVENYWPEIGKLASALSKKKTLHGQDVASLLSGSITKRRGHIMEY